MSRFFGLRVGKPTAKPIVLDEDVQITRATLTWKNSTDENKIAALIFHRDETNYIVCTLFPKPGYCHTPLDIRIEKDEKFMFACTNNNSFTMHLSGYTIPASSQSNAAGQEELPQTEVEADAQNPPNSSAPEEGGIPQGEIEADKPGQPPSVTPEPVLPPASSSIQKPMDDWSSIMTMEDLWHST